MKSACSLQNVDPPRAKPVVTIVVPTFRRPERLVECLDSCVAQTGPAAGTYEILVVDNCPDRSAKATVCDLARRTHVPLRYVHEPVAGISRARNTGLAYAAGDFVAFVDDDEVVVEDWLSHLSAAQAAFAADAVLAPVLPIIPPGLSPALKAQLLGGLSHWIPQPTGTPVGSTIVDPFWSRGGKAYPNLASGNCLIARRGRAAAVAFDDRLGRFGGEDALYFSELAALGCRLVWCAEAIAREHVPPGRLGLRYSLRRAFRGGQVASWTPLLMHPALPTRTALSMLIGAVQLPVFAALFCASFVFARQARRSYLARLASASGKLLWAAPFRRQTWPSWIGG
ncbi:glycosyltransferase family 2 protein [Alsobacter sp. KACC 23698]|uniref:Glycosyltransferase family 2 protein n=1 Tax=Alsobacter sp. KACC 23698 TaxID=3149229 RepID=A0AAU7JJ77_9HYPH